MYAETAKGAKVEGADAAIVELAARPLVRGPFAAIARTSSVPTDTALGETVGTRRARVLWHFFQHVGACSRRDIQELHRCGAGVRIAGRRRPAVLRRPAVHG